ncbi:MAG: hypothetical protein ACTS8P_06205, partial [Arsenophonus sp. NC-XBC3-MAG3]
MATEPTSDFILNSLTPQSGAPLFRQFEHTCQFGYSDGVITYERLIKLKKLVLKYKNFKLLALPGLSAER